VRRRTTAYVVYGRARGGRSFVGAIVSGLILILRSFEFVAITIHSSERVRATHTTTMLLASKYFRQCILGLSALTVVARMSAQAEFQKQFSPVFASNGNSCSSCHSAPREGGGGNVIVTRIQIANPSVAAANSVVLHQEPVAEAAPKESLQGERLTISLTGDATVEALDESSIKSSLERQRAASSGKISGHVVRAPALESRNSATAIGKFGWKAQHSSLRSACADSMLNELGVPNELYLGGGTRRPEDEAALERIVAFVRTLPLPERDPELASTEDAREGERIFSRIGCALCHVPTMKTLPAGTLINGGTYRVPEKIGGREVHPYSDFLLHDVGTGDGILQATRPEFVDPTTANLFRTPPLWGLRYRSWLTHDGKSVTLHQAIMRHAGEASDVVAKYESLTPKERHQLDQFLNSL
jgi:hypothetical protein